MGFSDYTGSSRPIQEVEETYFKNNLMRNVDKTSGSGRRCSAHADWQGLTVREFVTLGFRIR